MKKQIRFYYLKLSSYIFLIIGFIVFAKFAFTPELSKGIAIAVFVILFSVLYRAGEKMSMLPEGYSVSDALSFYRSCVLGGIKKAGYSQQLEIVTQVAEEFDVLKGKPSAELMEAYRKSEKIYKEVKIPESLFFGTKGGKK